VRDFLSAIRLANVLLVLTAQGLLLYKCRGLTLENLILLLLTSIWIMWGNIDNDIQDVALDTQYKKKKPNRFIHLLISSKNENMIERTVLLTSLLITSFMGWKEIICTLSAWIGLKTYNRYFKKLPLIGNFIISILCAASLYLFRLDLPTSIHLISGLIFTATLLRELVKDKEDAYADKLSGYNTFAILCPSQYFKLLLIILGVILTILAYLYLHNQPYLFLIFALNQFHQWYSIYRNQWKQASLMIKFQILVGVMGIGFI